MNKLVGSFFNRHAVTPTLTLASLLCVFVIFVIQHYLFKQKNKFLLSTLICNKNTMPKLVWELPLLVSKWFHDLFQRPHRATFHLSLTVLVHYRSGRVFSLAS